MKLLKNLKLSLNRIIDNFSILFEVERVAYFMNQVMVEVKITL